MTLKLFSRVRFVAGRFAPEGVPRGAIGYILEAYLNGDYEVEVSDPSGITIAQVVARDEDLELADLPEERKKMKKGSKR